MDAISTAEDELYQQYVDNELSAAIDELVRMNIPIGKVNKNVRLTRNRAIIGSCEMTDELSYNISISRCLLFNRCLLRTVIFHELIHTIPGCFSHSRLWKEYADTISETEGITIQRTLSLSR